MVILRQWTGGISLQNTVTVVMPIFYYNQHSGVVGLPLPCCLFCAWPMLHDYSLDYKDAHLHDNMPYTRRKTIYNIKHNYLWSTRQVKVIFDYKSLILGTLACGEKSSMAGTLRYPVRGHWMMLVILMT